MRSLAAALSLAAGGLAAQPAGMQAQVGSAALSQQGAALVVSTRNGPAGYSALDWQRFSIPAGSAVRFEQPTAASLSINRVTGGAPSSLMGTLSSNGRLVLVNPAGITVGAGAVVDTAGFTASTVNGSDADFLAGRFGSSRALAGTAADLVVDGRILARHGDVVLVGGYLRVGGRIEAHSASLEDGRVVLRALDQVQVTGEVLARRGEAGAGTGGVIDVFGSRVVLAAGALLDTSGAAGGGQIRVGGDYQGANAEVPNAQATRVEAGARILADATVRGDGGRVIVWADGRTDSAGAISARGGPQGGDGGFVEVSGHQQLVFTSAVDTRAPRGRNGLLLLDPSEFEVIGDDAVPDPDSTATFITASTLTGATTNYSLRANATITFSTPVTLPSGISMDIEAGGGIVINQALRTSGTGTITLFANGSYVPLDPQPVSLQVNAAIEAARITLQATGTGSVLQLQGADLQARQGALTLSAPTVSLAGSNRLWGQGGATVTGDLSLATGASLRTTGQASDGTLLPGQLDVSGAFSVADGATLRMALGLASQDRIRMLAGYSASFGGSSALVLDLLPGASRALPGTYKLIEGGATGTLPGVSGAGASAGTRLRWGSLEAVVPLTDNGALVAFVASPAAPPAAQAAITPASVWASGPIAYEDPNLDCP